MHPYFQSKPAANLHLNPQQRTPNLLGMFTAAARFDVDGVRAAVEKGEDANQVNGLGVSPLCVAAVGTSEAALATVQALCDGGADPGLVCPGNVTALHKACEFRAVRVVRWFIGTKPMPNPVQACATAGPGSDVAASPAGLDSIAVTVAPRRANVHAKLFNGRTPLFLAVKAGSLACVRLLLDAGAEVNVSDRNGWTPLHVAARTRHANIAAWLLAHGADQDATTKADALKPIMTLYKNVEDYWVVVRRKQAYEDALHAAKKAGHELPEPPRDPFNVAWETMFDLMQNPFLQRLFRAYTHADGLEGVPPARFEEFTFAKVPAATVVDILRVPNVVAARLAEEEALSAKLAKRRARGLLMK